MDKGFSTDHLEMIKEFNPQRVDGRSGIKDYLVPEKNYSKLVRKLGNLSCGVRDLSNNNVYNAIASAWCRTCSGEERLKVAAAGYEDPWSQPAYFFAFPRDIYTIKATVKMDIDKSHEMLDKYLENLNEELKEIAKEGLSLPENIRWSRDSNWRRSNESESVKIGERMNTLRYKTITFLQNLEIATKGITGVNPWETDYDHDESFNLCSSHNTKENLNIIDVLVRNKIEDECRIDKHYKLKHYIVPLNVDDLKVSFDVQKKFDSTPLKEVPITTRA